MRLEELESFLSVYENSSFTKASKLLFLEQPVVTKHIRQLEKEIGRPLFKRTTRAVSSTPEGDILYSKAKPALDLIRQGLVEIATLSESCKSALRVGYSHYYMDGLTVSWLSEFEDDHQGNLSITITESPLAKLMSSIAEGSVDCAFTGILEEGLLPSYFGRIPIMCMSEEIAMSDKHPLAMYSSVSIDDLLNERFIYPAQKPTAEHSTLLRDFEDAGREQLVHSTKYLDSALRIVATGNSLMDLPEKTPINNEHIVLVPYDSEHVIHYFLIWNQSNRSAALQDFIEFVDRKVTRL